MKIKQKTNENKKHQKIIRRDAILNKRICKSMQCAVFIHVLFILHYSNRYKITLCRHLTLVPFGLVIVSQYDFISVFSVKWFALSHPATQPISITDGRILQSNTTDLFLNQRSISYYYFTKRIQQRFARESGSLSGGFPS